MLACSSADDAPSRDLETDPDTGLPRCPEAPEDYPERCVDDVGAVVCPVESGFPGDEIALCDIAPNGILVHYGPESYDDPEEVAAFVIAPGAENESCLLKHTPNTEDMLMRAYHGRMRPHSHHMLAYAYDEDLPVTTVPEVCTQAGSLGRRWLTGSQESKVDVKFGPGTFEHTPEPGDPDYGVAVELRANTSVNIDLHYINVTDDPILAEAWIQYEAADPNEVEQLSDMTVFLQTQISVPPLGSATTEKLVCTATTPRYVSALQGHFHENGLRFSVWKRDVEGNDTLVYETYDWAEPGGLYFRDGIENPPADAASRRMGGASGYLRLEPGESLVHECEFANPSTEVVGFGLAGKNQMCNLFGFWYPSEGQNWRCPQ